MKAAGGLLLTALLMSAASPSAGERHCPEELDFAPDGTIVRWTVCRGSLAQRFAEPGDERLRLNVKLHDDTDLHWSPTPGSDEMSFAASSVSGALEVRRRYQQTGRTTLLHTISIRNASQETLSPELAVRIGGPPGRQREGRRSLADFVYDFARADVQASNGWETAVEGSKSTRFALISRHQALVVDSEREFSVAGAGEWELVWSTGPIEPGGMRTLRHSVSALPMELAALAKQGDGGLMYADLWPPLAALTRGVEYVLSAMARIGWGPAVAIIIFAALVRLATFPVTLWSARRQHEFAAVQQRMQPEIARAKSDYTGAEQSERILAIYRENGVTPFTGLKGSVGLFVQIPFLLAVFNVTTYSAMFAGQDFLWIADLAQPDGLAALPAVVPLLGNQFNVLPLALAVVNVLSLHAQTGQDGSRPGITSIIFTVLIAVLFYSFAAAVVLYWLAVNLLQAGERALVRHRNGTGAGDDHAFGTA